MSEKHYNVGNTHDAAFAEGYKPVTQTVVKLMPSIVDTTPLITTHVDTITGLLLTIRANPEANVSIFGRCIDQPGQISTIMSDEMYENFVHSRRDDRERILQIVSERMGQQIVHVSMRVDQGLRKSFPCTFYDGNKLVEGWESDKLTPIHLLPVFGGATEHTFGSDTASLDELNEVGYRFMLETQRRQLHGAHLLGATSLTDIGAGHWMGNHD